MCNQFFAFIFIIFSSLITSQVVIADSNINQKNNEFYDIKIRLLNKSESAVGLQCHKKLTNDATWQAITFESLPQNQHFCFRASINIDQSTLTKDPILLIGMLASAQIYWDGKLLINKGVVGGSFESETPATIKTLARIPDQNLKTGQHVLSAEMSTFHVGKKLKSIGFIFRLFDEQMLNNAVLIVSMICALFVGILLILSIILQLIFWLYQRNFPYQLFSLFCFFSALLLSTEQAKFWLNYTYNWHIYRLTLIYILTLSVSFLLPVFYLYQYRFSSMKIWAFAIMVSLVGLCMSYPGYDTTSSLLFSGSLIWASIINVYYFKKERGGKVNLILLLLGLSFVVFIPEYYSEVGFGLIFICIVMMMLVTLIKEMYIHKEQSLKAERVKTELLRRNMQPHFLMNCLTQLLELIEVKPKEATVLISALSDEFRQLTHQSDQGCVALSDEINLCRKHLEIMSLRYQQSYKLTITGETENISVPSSILHSQIENCFTHNHISINRAFELTIKKVKEQIHLTLKTPIEKKVNHQGTGTGERYIKAKLAEVSQTNSTFESYQENQYWLSKFTYPNIEEG
jgi:sensor histidine kinase YesM